MASASLIAFGLGALIGGWLNGSVFAVLLGLGFLTGGIIGSLYRD